MGPEVKIPFKVGSNVIGKLLQLMLFGLVHSDVRGQLSTQECSELGFGSQLMCGSCDLLPQFNLTSLQDDCLQCCQTEAEEDGTKKFPFARLEVCG
ncbi:unnamed protein product [Clavelina lepadiformis]|uniref:15 kDa selenoprotein n=1 Tax=Clavelina lepadiformis TaxID=159417 RepID=A0ABP0G4E4_CLALP